jgi:hypothetical protein
MSESSCSNIDLTDIYQKDTLGNSNKEEKCFEICCAGKYIYKITINKDDKS